MFKWLILGDFLRFFGIFWDLLSPFITQYLTLWSSKCFVMVCHGQSFWEKMVQNDMPHPMFIPRIKKSTLLVNLSLRETCFAVLIVYFAIFIYGNYRDVVFQNSFFILHPLICDNHKIYIIFWQVVWKLVYSMWKIV